MCFEKSASGSTGYAGTTAGGSLSNAFAFATGYARASAATGYDRATAAARDALGGAGAGGALLGPVASAVAFLREELASYVGARRWCAGYSTAGLVTRGLVVAG